MNPQHANKISRFLSLVLRHKTETIGISLSGDGWTHVDDISTNGVWLTDQVPPEFIEFPE
jgi:putative RNA 2'-phosphotransferase